MGNIPASESPVCVHQYTEARKKKQVRHDEGEGHGHSRRLARGERERESIHMKSHSLQDDSVHMNKPSAHTSNMETHQIYPVLEKQNVPWAPRPRFRLFHQEALVDPEKMEEKNHQRHSFTGKDTRGQFLTQNPLLNTKLELSHEN